MRSPHALINDGKDPYSEATPDSPQGRLERSKTVDQLRPRLASHLSTRQSLHSPRNESLVYAQWFHQVSTTKKGGAIDDALALRTTRG